MPTPIGIGNVVRDAYGAHGSGARFPRWLIALTFTVVTATACLCWHRQLRSGTAGPACGVAADGRSKAGAGCSGRQPLGCVGVKPGGMQGELRPGCTWAACVSAGARRSVASFANVGQPRASPEGCIQVWYRRWLAGFRRVVFAACISRRVWVTSASALVPEELRRGEGWLHGCWCRRG